MHNADRRESVRESEMGRGGGRLKTGKEVGEKAGKDEGEGEI